MSFSGDIKEELSKPSSAGRHCRLAETAAILSLCGKIIITENDRYCVKIQTENLQKSSSCKKVLYIIEKSI